MAEIYVRHSLNSSKAVKFNFTFKQFTLKDSYGDSKWVLEVGTTYPAADGGKVPVKVVNNINEGTLEDEIEKAISELCAYIDWSTFEEDKWPPELAEVHPTGSNTPIKSLVIFNVTDKLPSSGIDLSEMKVTLNNGVVDFDITEDTKITGDPYDYIVTWKNPFG